MPYRFTCPHCQTKTDVEDRYSGLAGECVSCGGAIVLPTFAAKPSASVSALPASSQSGRVAGWIAAALVALLLVGTLLFTVVRFGGRTITTLANTREQTASMRNLEKIAAALNAYAADQGRYPPSATRDANQVKLHSWRVLILPYLGEDDLYNRFDLTLPWDHPTNQAAATYRVPNVYQHPSSSLAGVFNEASYYLITGPGTVFAGRQSLRPIDISDDLSKTILVTEGAPILASSSWVEPVDLDVTQMRGQLGNNGGNEPGGLSEGGVGFATADGRAHFVPETMDPSVIRALVTPQGGERLPDDILD